MCCDHGQVVLPSPPPPPQFLRHLLVDDTPQANEFRANIRRYNAALAFTSLGVDIDDKINVGRGVYTFRIHGELYHRIACLLPSQGRTPLYAQLYIHDPQFALQTRMQNPHNEGLYIDTMHGLQQMLQDVNPYATAFRHAFEIMERDGVGSISMKLCLQETRDRRRYNLPSADEIAGLVPGDGTQVTDKGRDIILRHCDGPLHRIDDSYAGYLPLHYVLLFPFGEDGWSRELRLYQPNHQGNLKSLTQTRFHAYCLQHREGEFSTLLHGGRLLQQYIVDGWASAEQYRLNFLRTHQDEIRAELYSGLQDALADADEVDLNELGERIILPSSHQGSPRHMLQLFQDAMALARYFHQIDAFITVTANPNWQEIREALLPGQSPSNRPDIVAQVFRLKIKVILDEINDKGIFGKAAAHIYTIEFQKRGLPHMHLLVFFSEE